jgi:serine/threonine protein kinase
VATRGQRIGRYVLHDAIASGGMASVHFGRMVGPGGFARTVVIKRLHPHLAQDLEFTSMFLDEGRLAARIGHPNVVATIDVASLEGELLLVMEYVRGESLSRLWASARARDELIPIPILSSIVLGVLYGLEVAHEAKTEQGEPLSIVHRDVSPQNILVGADGLTRVLDFGVAKAASRAHSTRDGKIKGKVAYMAPEQIQRLTVDRRADLYGVGVVLWEALAGRRLFTADDAVGIMHAVLHEPIPLLSTVAPGAPLALQRIVEKALSRRPEDRYASALEMADAIETAAPPALQRQVGAWVATMAAEALAERDRILSVVETSAPSEVGATPPLPDHLVRLSEQATAIMPVPEGPSMVTGLSISDEVTPRKRVGGRGLLMAAALGGACVGGLALVRTPRVAPTEQVTAASPLAQVAPAEAASAASSSLAPSPSAISPPESSARADAALAPRPSTAPVVHPSHRAPPAKSGRARPQCDPPLVVGADGIERFNPACL